MASSTPVCGICEGRNLGNISEVWCSECGEGLCESCRDHHAVSRASRTHKTVPIDEYMKLPAEILTIREQCDKHDEKFQTYCRNHNCPCCRVCVIEDHGKCDDKVLLEKVIQNVKISSYFDETEQLMGELLETVSIVRKDRENNLISIRDQRKSIEEKIQRARIKINDHLDKLENDLRKEMSLAEEQVKMKTNEVIASLEKEKNKLSKYESTFIHLKKYGSDLQTYCALNKIHKESYAIDQNLKAIVHKGELDKSLISVTINTNLQDAILCTQRFGDIKLESKPATVKITRKKQKQAQMIVPHVPSKSIDTIQVTTRRIIEMHGRNVTGCLSLPDGTRAFSDCSDDVIRFINEDGNQISDIQTGTETFDIVYIEDKNSIAVTSGWDRKQCITIIDNESKQIIKTIPVGSNNFGITYRNDTLYFFAYDKGLCKINLRDNSVRDVCTGPLYGLAYVASFNDKLYYTDRVSYTVTCCDLQGKTLWQFKDNTILKYPWGIDCDNNGNIYVAGNGTQNVVVITPDGSQCRQLLSASDGLDKPQVLHFDRLNNNLVVSNICKTAFLFNVKE